MVKNNSLNLLELVRDILDDKEVFYTYVEDKQKILFTMNTRDTLRAVECHIYLHETAFTTYAYFPFRADIENEDEMHKVSEFIHRANYGLRFGNFEFDFRDGEIRYKFACDCEGENDTLFYSKNILERAIMVPLAMMKKYAPGLIDVLYKDVSPRNAVNKCEESSQETSSSVRQRLNSLLERLLASTDSSDGEEEDHSDTSELDLPDTSDLFEDEPEDGDFDVFEEEENEDENEDECEDDDEKEDDNLFLIFPTYPPIKRKTYRIRFHIQFLKKYKKRCYLDFATEITSISVVFVCIFRGI